MNSENKPVEPFQDNNDNKHEVYEETVIKIPELDSSILAHDLNQQIHEQKNNVSNPANTPLNSDLNSEKKKLENTAQPISNEYAAGYDPSIPLVATGKIELPEPTRKMEVGTGDIHAYEIHNALSLKTGERTRDWMDDSNGKHAYRCLPLVIANQMGWDFLCPVDFMAIWDGGGTVDSVKIGFKRDERNKILSHPSIQSHFGYGIITFSLGNIFRTPKGTNLICKGASNYIKDGIQALEGVIETDWSPFTFTMNWKLTRINHPVEFLAGEPICRVIPYPRGYIQQFNPVISNMKDDPEFYDEYMQWSKSRDLFNNKLHDKESEESKQKWQKHYMRGMSFVEQKEFKDHETKIQLKEFTRIISPKTSEDDMKSKMKEYSFIQPTDDKSNQN